ncbi:MAG TPA: TrbC/VirB2 family protein [Allosphingosinicella sp.]|jgi:type IV secretion system protein VirB2
MSLSDPGGASALAAAVLWVQDTLLGTAATAVAVIAVASVGLMMLAGRVDARRAGTVLLGCFILFGAARIAAGLRATAEEGDTPLVASEPAAPLAPAPAPRPPTRSPAADPYAGAAVPAS